MGCNSSKNKGFVKKFPSEHKVAKTVTIIAKICSSWGFDMKRAEVEALAESISNSLGVTAISIVHPLENSNGKFELYQLNAEKKEVMIFTSNLQDKREGVVNGLRLSKKTEEVKDKIVPI